MENEDAVETPEVAAPETPESEAPETGEQAEASEVAAFDAGLKAAAEQDKPPEADKPEGEEAQGEKPEAGKPKDDKPKDEGKKDEPDEDVEKEIAERGLKGKSADRFREITRENKRLRELEPQFEAAVARAREWEDTVASTGATPEQFGRALTFLQLINTGDPVKMRQAYDAIAAEQKWLAEKLGIEAPGYDPLDQHADLKASVDSGDMTRKAALEVAQARRVQGMATESQQRTQQQAEQQQRIQQAAGKVTALGQQWAASDPHYAAKLPALKQQLEVIRQYVAPEGWAAAVEAFYKTIPNPAPKPPPPNSPARATGVPSGGVAPKLSTDNAFDMGLQEAARRGVGGI